MGGKRDLAEFAKEGGTLIWAPNFYNNTDEKKAKKAKLEKETAAAAAKEVEKEAKKTKKELKDARHASAVKILAESRPDLGKAAIAASGKTEEEKEALKVEQKEKMKILKGDPLELMKLVGTLWQMQKINMDIDTT
ncbi:MAG: hypothetical protein Q9199_007246 [Rusavskia elegans]